MTETGDKPELGPLIREALQELHDATPEQIEALQDIFREHLGKDDTRDL